MSKIKYVRVSTEEQNEGRQVTNSNEFAKVYTDKVSGSIKFADRKEGKRLLSDIDSGNITEVHIASIDRLGRNIIDVLIMVEYFNKKLIRIYVENIGMYSLINGKTNPSFKMIVSVLGNVAEMERSNMIERQKQGIELAKAKGLYTGRSHGTKISHEQLLEKYKTLVRELKKGESLRRAAKLGGCSLGTAQKVKTLIESKHEAV